MNLEKIKETTELVAFIIMVCGLIYRIAKMENSIYVKIDAVNDYTRENIIKIKSQLDLMNYRLDDLNNKFHQIDRALRENDISVKVRKEDR